MEIPGNLTPGALGALDLAYDEARNVGHGYVGTEHLFLALFVSGSMGTLISPGVALMSKAGLEAPKLRLAVRGLGGIASGARIAVERKLAYTARLRSVISLAAHECKALNHPLIGTEHLLLALLREEAGAPFIRKTVSALGVDPEHVRSEILSALRPSGPLHAPSSGSAPGESPLAQRAQGETATPAAAAQPGAIVSILATFGKDLTARAREGGLDPVVERETEIQEAAQILCRRTKNNPVLIGEAGVGKTAVVEGLAQLIVSGRAPKSLIGKRIIQLDASSLVAGTKYRGEFETRIRSMLDEVRANPDVILFIDELHTLVGAGRAEGSADAANIMKPALSRGELRCVGATTIEEYSRYIEKDAALERRFQSVMVKEPSVAASLVILKGLRSTYEKHHEVQITDAALEAAVKLSKRYQPARFLPDKAIDLMDEAAVESRFSHSKAEADTVGLRDAATAASREVIEAVSRGDTAGAAACRLKEIEALATYKHARHMAGSARPIVTEETVAVVLSRKTGIPVARMGGDEKARLVALEETFRKAVIGQDFACSAVARTLRRNRTGMRDARRPVGSFLFMGPTGVGKTQLSRQVAIEFCGEQDALLQLDMSEFMEAQSAAKLIGSPPGYVDSDRGGILTEALRRRPHTVVLFDEIEKAHPYVLQLLLQILEEGRLTDSRGRVANFSNAVVILTSNVGSGRVRAKPSMGFGGASASAEDFAAITEAALADARTAFKPELLNRIGDIVVFRALDREDIEHIFKLEIAKVGARSREQGIHFAYSDKAKFYLCKEGYDERYGARPLRRAIERHVEDVMAMAILKGEVKAGDMACVDVKDDGTGLCVYTIDR